MGIPVHLFHIKAHINLHDMIFVAPGVFPLFHPALGFPIRHGNAVTDRCGMFRGRCIASRFEDSENPCRVRLFLFQSDFDDASKLVEHSAHANAPEPSAFHQVGAPAVLEFGFEANCKAVFRCGPGNFAVRGDAIEFSVVISGCRFNRNTCPCLFVADDFTACPHKRHDPVTVPEFLNRSSGISFGPDNRVCRLTWFMEPLVVLPS